MFSSDQDIIARDPEHMDVISVEVINNGNDDSVASADEFVPEPQQPPPNLNYLVQTNQLV